MKREYSVVVMPEWFPDGTYIYLAEHPRLPGCMAFGATPDEALAALDDLRPYYLRYVREHGAVPTPDPEPTTLIWRAPERKGS